MFTAYQVSKYLKAMGFNVTYVGNSEQRVDLGDGRIRVQIESTYMYVEEQVGHSDYKLYPQRASLREIRTDLEEITGGKHE